jgi:hypothetical protein
VTPATPQPKIDVVLERLDNIASVQRDQSANLTNLSCNFQNFQLIYTKSHEQLIAITEQTVKRVDHIEEAVGDMLPVLTKTETIESRLNAHDKHFDDVETERKEDREAVETERKEDREDLEKQIKAVADAVQIIRDAIHPLVFANRIIVWIGAIFGASVIALIWGILTHHIELLYH